MIDQFHRLSPTLFSAIVPSIPCRKSALKNALDIVLKTALEIEALQIHDRL
ncbi:hypothetical protein [Castellaniella defragrans]|uniref:hypothetical protein n=1 Tax=Castellaniella defragrans TaxID=75697 RepID=UPI002AFFDDF8|nr:hypothetical protein [Castellaniella defragrans]